MNHAAMQRAMVSALGFGVALALLLVMAASA
jgi:hypothetical protein